MATNMNNNEIIEIMNGESSIFEQPSIVEKKINVPAIYFPDSLVMNEAGFFESDKVNQKTGNNLIYTPYEKIIIPSSPNYAIDQRPINGVDNRKVINSFGTVDISNINDTPQDILHAIGADFHVIKQFSPMTSAPNSPLQRKPILAMEGFPEVQIGDSSVNMSYPILDYDACASLFFDIIDSFRQAGYDCYPAYGRVYGGKKKRGEVRDEAPSIYGDRSKIFLQYRVTGNNILGEPVDTYLAMMSGHDGKTPFQIALTVVRLFCKNQIRRAFSKKNGNVKKFKHTITNQTLLTDKALANNILIETAEYQKNSLRELEEYADKLAMIKVSEKNIYNAYLTARSIENQDTQQKIDTIQRDAAQVIACYHEPDVNDFRGTALGAYYAFTDFSDHVIHGRTLTAVDSQIERSYNTPDLETFVDYLVDIKG